MGASRDGGEWRECKQQESGVDWGSHKRGYKADGGQV